LTERVYRGIEGVEGKGKRSTGKKEREGEVQRVTLCLITARTKGGKEWLLSSVFVSVGRKKMERRRDLDVFTVVLLNSKGKGQNNRGGKKKEKEGKGESVAVFTRGEKV